MKIKKYTVGILLLALIAYNSFNFRKLDEVKAKALEDKFDIESYAQDFWDTKLPDAIAGAVDINLILNGLKNNPESTFETYGHQLGISKVHYFMVKGKGVISSIADENLVVELDNGSIDIATDFIFGNAVRDGSEEVDINEFRKLMDFNMVSVAINKRIRKEIIPELKNNAVKRASIEFAGAVEVNEEKSVNLNLRIIPVRATISNNGNPE